MILIQVFSLYFSIINSGADLKFSIKFFDRKKKVLN